MRIVAGRHKGRRLRTPAGVDIGARGPGGDAPEEFPLDALQPGSQ